VIRIPGPGAGASAVMPGPGDSGSWGTMESATLRLTWGFTAFGFQPLLLENLLTGGAVTYEPGALFGVEFVDGLDANAEGALTRIGPQDVGNANVTVEQLSDTSWSVIWEALGAEVALTVTLVGTAVDWGFAVLANDSGLRARAIVGPMLRFVPPNHGTASAKGDRFLTMLWGAGVIPAPGAVLYNDAVAGATEAGTFLTGWTERFAPGYSGHSSTCPGNYVADVGGFISTESEHVQVWHSTDVVGVVKEWFGLADEDGVVLVGWRHWVPGSADNVYAVPYSIRTHLVASERGAGGQVMDIADTFRAWIESLAPVPEWYRTPGASSGSFLDEIISTLSLLTVDRETVAGPANLGTATVIGERTATVVPASGSAWTNDPLTATDTEYVELAPRTKSYQVLWVEAGSGVERVLHLGEPIVSTLAVGSAVTFHVSPYSAVTETSLAKVRAWIENYLDWSGLDPSELLYHGYVELPRGDGTAMAGFPYWVAGSVTGYSPALRAHREALKALGVRMISYSIHGVAPTAGRALTDMLPDYEAVADDYVPVVNEGQLQIGGGGPHVSTDMNVPLVRGVAVRELCERAMLDNMDGVYLDAHLGAPGSRHRPVGAYLADEDQADPSSFAGAVELANAIRRSVRTNPEEVIYSEPGSALSPDSTGRLLVNLCLDGVLGDGNGNAIAADAAGTLIFAGPYNADGSRQDLVVGDGAGNMIGDGAGNVIGTGRYRYTPPRFLTVTENAVQHGLHAVDLFAIKQAFPLEFFITPIVQFWGALFGSRGCFYDLTDKFPNVRIRLGRENEDFTAANLAAQLYGHLQAFFAGMIQGYSMVCEATEVQVATIAPGSPPGADLLPREAKLIAFGLHLALWDRNSTVRRFRRGGGRFAGHAWGSGHFSELWLEDWLTAVLSGEARDAGVFRDPVGGGLLVVLANIVAETDDDAAVSVVLTPAEYPELSSATVVRELAQDGTVTAVVGALAGGVLTLSEDVPARAVRIFEVL
jgi:hypothetical protein